VSSTSLLHIEHIAEICLFLNNSHIIPFGENYFYKVNVTENVNRSTDNTMVKKKTKQRETNDRQRFSNPTKTGVNSCAPEV
jgi:hypothetical protein